MQVIFQLETSFLFSIKMFSCSSSTSVLLFGLESLSGVNFDEPSLIIKVLNCNDISFTKNFTESRELENNSKFINYPTTYVS